jgi:serine/threonine-protein kinase
VTRYELLERIGVGGMAEIFRGKAVAGSGFQKHVAIKRILPHLSQDTRFVELLITEAKTLSELRHRNIVQIYDVGLGDDGQYFLVMEFVDGLDIADLFDRYERKRTNIPLDVALYTAEEVCEALEHAHAARDAGGQLIGLVHRDVSPSNILLSKSGEVKLTDFGIAKRMEELTGHGGVRGKFAYISPEQANNTHVDGRSDVCSLGMVLFELISGRRLFSQMPDFDALKMVRGHQIPALGTVADNVSSALEAIVMRAVAPDPDDRYQSAGEFASALRDYRYNLGATSGDPSQAVATLVVDNTVGSHHPRPEDLDPGSEPEPTIMRIKSAAGFGVGFPDLDPFAGAREMLDNYGDDEMTLATGTEPPQPPPRGRSVDPDADTELAILSSREAAAAAGSDDDADDDADFEGELETKLFDRSDPIIAAAILGQAKRAKAALPPPNRDEVAQTVPRAEPVKPVESRPPRIESRAPSVAPIPEVSARSVAAVAPRYPRASPEVLRQVNHRPAGMILGLPRRTFYWVAGIGGGLLLILIIALAAGGDPSGGAGVDAGATSTTDAPAIDGGVEDAQMFIEDEPDPPKPDKSAKPKKPDKRRRGK